MFSTIVHQTLEDRSNADEIEAHGPYAVANIERAYLGSGYYFWDDHIELAHWWGTNRIKKSYVICQANLEVQDDLFFDLIGSRQAQKYFLAVIKRIKAENWAIGKIIEYLKNMEKSPTGKGIFPYKVIRAMDVERGTFDMTAKAFAAGKNGMTQLTPKMLICVTEKNPVYLSDFRIVHPEIYC